MLQPHGMPFFLITCYLTIFSSLFFEVFKSNISHSVHSFPFRGGVVHPLTYIHHTSTYQASMCKLMEYWWGRSFCLSYHPAFKDDDMVFYLQHLFQILQLKSCHTFSSGSVEREWDSGKWKWKWNYTCLMWFATLFVTLMSLFVLKQMKGLADEAKILESEVSKGSETNSTSPRPSRSSGGSFGHRDLYSPPRNLAGSGSRSRKSS